MRQVIQISSGVLRLAVNIGVQFKEGEERSAVHTRYGKN